MPPTYDPQAPLNTAPQHVLFHVRHFVADRRRAYVGSTELSRNRKAPFRVYMRRQVALKVCGNVCLPMHVLIATVARRRHSTFDARFVTGCVATPFPIIPHTDSHSGSLSRSTAEL